MAGSKESAKKAAETMRAKYGDDFYKNIGKEGGKAKVPTKGFGTDKRTALDRMLGKPKLASIAGSKGGTISRRGKATIQQSLQGAANS